MSRTYETDHLSGAEYLASIYGTEKDKVNCSFYFKVCFCCVNAKRHYRVLDRRMPARRDLLESPP